MSYFLYCLSFPDAAEIYTWFTAGSAMRAARAANRPAILATLAKLGEILRNQVVYTCHENILMATLNIEDGSPIIVLGCRQFLNAACAGAVEVHFDATFKVVPAAPQIRQLFSMHIIKQNHVSH